MLIMSRHGLASSILIMLYVVNDKVPGRLIIVMATTKGFAGKDAALVQMTFELLQDIKKEEKVTIRISEAELMSDTLQRIEINPQ